MALNNLGIRLAEAGQRQAALAPAQEAADTYRQLAAANPDAYLPDLATALNNLGNRLARPGSGRPPWPPPRKPPTPTASSPRPTPTPTSPTWPWR